MGVIYICNHENNVPPGYQQNGVIACLYLYVHLGNKMMLCTSAQRFFTVNGAMI